MELMKVPHFTEFKKCTIFGGDVLALPPGQVSVVQDCYQGMDTQREVGCNVATESEVLLSEKTNYH